MRPIGFIENYQTFSEQFWSVLEQEKAIGFLLDCPKTFSLDKSGVINSPRAVMALDELMSTRMSIYYLTPRIEKSDQRSIQASNKKIASDFNDQVISGLNLSFKVNYPCLLLFMPNRDKLVDRIYIDLGKDSCFYFEDLHRVISAYLERGNSQGLGSRMMHVFKYGCEAISEELPKTVLVKSVEMGAALLIG
jgi:hypothetical protein